MTKGTTNGLLSKMVKFVRHPTRDWSELDSIGSEPEQEPDRGYSKQSLKEMIERKRQNDFVRRREFDELRKLRRNGPVASAEALGRPSFFQGTTTTSNLEDRAMTIKKIDEIEAQMSKQWWKGKQDEATVHGGSFPVSGKLPLPQEAKSAGTGSDPGPNTDFDATRPGESGSDGLKAAAAPRQKPPYKSSINRQTESGISGFSPSKLFSIELGDSLADTDMEEAAIRFANGDNAGAETCLLTALKTEDIRPEAANGWAAALFDLYRATGQRGSFDRVATEYAQRYGYEAPTWFSMPELLAQKSGAAAPERVSMSRQTSPAMWECPASLGLKTVQDLRASLSHAPEPWHLNWSRFTTATPEAAAALADLFAQWCVQPVILRFEGAEALDKTLRSFTPSGDKSIAGYWWRLRLDALRIMRLQDEFELAALDFCVTYEVSPPPWQNAQCEYLAQRSGAPSARDRVDQWDRDASTEPDSRSDNVATIPMQIDDIAASVIELSGEVLGDATEALNRLQSGLRGANRLIIACDRLIRVDFSAAGSILNWVAAREVEGCHVQFREVPRLVAAFFNVIGVSEHARVMVRTS
ncbi:MAG: STAS domain-containing protein [Rhodoferax sp.]